MKKFPFLKSTSAFTLFCFLLTQSATAAPGLAIVRRGETPVSPGFTIPTELAVLETLHQAPQSSRLIFEIQNAHANYGAQVQIREILKYLHQHYGIQTVFVEGAAEKLNPDYLNFFPDKERNLKLADWFAKEGILDGAGLFIADEIPGTEGLPIEDVELYRKNYQALKKVFAAKPQIDRELASLEAEISKAASKKLSNELRQALEEWRLFEKGHREFLPFVSRLADQVHRVLGLDLQNILSQTEWPQLARLLALQKTEKQLDITKALNEKSRLISFLKSKGVSGTLIDLINVSFLNDLIGNPKIDGFRVKPGMTEKSNRQVLEDLITQARPKGLLLKDWPAFTNFVAYLALKQELDAQALVSEIQILFQKMIDSLAKTAEEKELVSFIRDFGLLTKLLHLELSRAEWIELQRRGITVENILKYFQNPKSEIRNPKQIPNQKSQNSKRFFWNLKTLNLEKTYHNAVSFYELALKRDQMFYQKLDQQMRERGITKAAIVTGGFHTKGLGDIFRKEGTSFAVLTPHIAELSGNALYYEAMLESKCYPFQVSYLSKFAPQVSQPAMKALHGSPLFLFTSAVNGMSVVGTRNLIGEFNGSPAALAHGVRLEARQAPHLFRIVPAALETQPKAFPEIKNRIDKHRRSETRTVQTPMAPEHRLAVERLNQWVSEHRKKFPAHQKPTRYAWGIRNLLTFVQAKSTDYFKEADTPHSDVLNGFTYYAEHVGKDPDRKDFVAHYHEFAIFNDRPVDVDRLFQSIEEVLVQDYPFATRWLMRLYLRNILDFPALHRDIAGLLFHAETQPVRAEVRDADGLKIKKAESLNVSYHTLIEAIRSIRDLRPLFKLSSSVLHDLENYLTKTRSEFRIHPGQPSFHEYEDIVSETTDLAGRMGIYERPYYRGPNVPAAIYADSTNGKLRIFDHNEFMTTAAQQAGKFRGDDHRSEVRTNIFNDPDFVRTVSLEDFNRLYRLQWEWDIQHSREWKLSVLGLKEKQPTIYLNPIFTFKNLLSEASAHPGVTVEIPIKLFEEETRDVVKKIKNERPEEWRKLISCFRQPQNAHLTGLYIHPEFLRKPDDFNKLLDWIRSGFPRNEPSLVTIKKVYHETLDIWPAWWGAEIIELQTQELLEQLDEKRQQALADFLRRDSDNRQRRYNLVNHLGDTSEFGGVAAGLWFEPGLTLEEAEAFVDGLQDFKFNTNRINVSLSPFTADQFTKTIDVRSASRSELRQQKTAERNFPLSALELIHPSDKEGVSEDADVYAGSGQTKLGSQLLRGPSGKLGFQEAFDQSPLLINKPAKKARTAMLSTKSLTHMDNAVKKLLAYAAPSVIEKTFKHARWMKSHLGGVKNSLVGFIQGMIFNLLYKIKLFLNKINYLSKPIIFKRVKFLELAVWKAISRSEVRKTNLPIEIPYTRIDVSPKGETKLPRFILRLAQGDPNTAKLAALLHIPMSQDEELGVVFYGGDVIGFFVDAKDKREIDKILTTNARLVKSEQLVDTIILGTAKSVTGPTLSSVILVPIFAANISAHISADKVSFSTDRVVKTKMEKPSPSSKAREARQPKKRKSRTELRYAKLTDFVPGGRAVERLKGTGLNWFLGINASTQSITFTLESADARNERIIWTHQEKFDQEKYARFGAPQGHIEAVNQKQRNRYVTDPLMVAMAFEESMKALKVFIDGNGLQMSNIKAISPGAQQHATVYLTEEAAKAFDSSVGAKSLWRQIRDDHRLSWEYSPIWRDKSTAKQGRRLIKNKRFGSQKALLEQTGSEFQARFFAGQIDKFREDEPKKYSKTAKILNMTAFIGYLLTGKYDFAIDQGEAVASHLANVEKRNWHENLNEIIPDIEGKLPEVKLADEIEGDINAYWTKPEFGLAKDVKITVGTGDNPADLVGFGVFEKGKTVMSLGTSFTLFQYINNLKDLRAAIQKSNIGNIMGTPMGKWMKLICFQNGGLALEKIRDKYIPRNEALDYLVAHGLNEQTFTRKQIGKMSKDERKKLISAAKWAIFEGLVASVPAGNHGKMMITMNKDETVIDIKHQRGQYFSNLKNFDPKNRAQILRAAAEGQIYFLKYVADKIGLEIKEINLTGGAAKSPSLRQIIADVFGVPVYVLKKEKNFDKDAVSLGTAGIARNGYFKNAVERPRDKKPVSWQRTVKHLATLDEEVTSPRNHEHLGYRKYLGEFGNLVEKATAKSVSRNELRWNPQATDELRDAVVRTWHLAFTEKQKGEISKALFERHVTELNRLLDLDAHQGLKPQIVRANDPASLEDPRAKLLNLLNNPISLERKYNANLSLEVRQLADQLVLPDAAVQAVKEDDKDRAKRAEFPVATRDIRSRRELRTNIFHDPSFAKTVSLAVFVNRYRKGWELDFERLLPAVPLMVLGFRMEPLTIRSREELAQLLTQVSDSSRIQIQMPIKLYEESTQVVYTGLKNFHPEEWKKLVSFYNEPQNAHLTGLYIDPERRRGPNFKNFLNWILSGFPRNQPLLVTIEEVNGETLNVWPAWWGVRIYEPQTQELLGRLDKQRQQALADFFKLEREHFQRRGALVNHLGGANELGYAAGLWFEPGLVLEEARAFVDGLNDFQFNPKIIKVSLSPWTTDQFFKTVDVRSASRSELRSEYQRLRTQIDALWQIRNRTLAADLENGLTFSNTTYYLDLEIYHKLVELDKLRGRWHYYDSFAGWRRAHQTSRSRRELRIFNLSFPNVFPPLRQSAKKLDGSAIWLGGKTGRKRLADPPRILEEIGNPSSFSAHLNNAIDPGSPFLSVGARDDKNSSLGSSTDPSRLRKTRTELRAALVPNAQVRFRQERDVPARDELRSQTKKYFWGEGEQVWKLMGNYRRKLLDGFYRSRPGLSGLYVDRRVNYYNQIDRWILQRGFERFFEISILTPQIHPAGETLDLFPPFTNLQTPEKRPFTQSELAEYMGKEVIPQITKAIEEMDRRNPDQARRLATQILVTINPRETIGQIQEQDTPKKLGYFMGVKMYEGILKASNLSDAQQQATRLFAYVPFTASRTREATEKLQGLSKIEAVVDLMKPEVEALLNALLDDASNLIEAQLSVEEFISHWFPNYTQDLLSSQRLSLQLDASTFRTQLKLWTAQKILDRIGETNLQPAKDLAARLLRDIAWIVPNPLEQDLIRQREDLLQTIGAEKQRIEEKQHLLVQRLRQELRKAGPAVGHFSPVPSGEGKVTAAELVRVTERMDEEVKNREDALYDEQPLYDEFDQVFGRALKSSRGNMKVFAAPFLDAYRAFGGSQQVSSQRKIFMKAIERLAQDPGAPFGKPGLSYYNPARYLFARLQEMILVGFQQKVLEKTVSKIKEQVISKGINLKDVKAKAKAIKQLQKELGRGRQEGELFAYEIFYDSLVEKGGEYYLTVQVLLGNQPLFLQNDIPPSKEAVVQELLITIPAPGKAAQYQNPYFLWSTPTYQVGILDSIHYINQRFPEWRPKAQRDVYAARVEALKKSGVKRQFLRPSVRQGFNHRFFEPFFREYLIEDAPLAYHIVHTQSERDYGNVTGVTAVMAIANAIAVRGGNGVTASWYLENPRVAEKLIGKELIYSFEWDHHRIDTTENPRAFAKNLSYFLGAYEEAVSTGWGSANLQDETKFIPQKIRNVLMALEEIAKTKEINEEKLKQKFADKKSYKDPDFSMERVYKVLQEVMVINPEVAVKVVEQIQRTGNIDRYLVLSLLQAIYHGDSTVKPGIPNALDMHSVRTVYLKNLIKTAGKKSGITPFENFYIEPDYALDAQPHTLEEFMYLTLMEWLHSQAHGYPFGPGVPSYGNVHGASAGNPNLALAGIFQYGAQTVTAYADDPSKKILDILRKNPHGITAKFEALLAEFKDGEEEERLRVQELVKLLKKQSERTAEEERILRAYVRGQFELIEQKAPDAFRALKKAERAGRSLARTSPKTKAKLDKKFARLPLNRRAWITTHAASGLSAKQLRKAKEYGVIFANKSTEFQNVIFKVLELVSKLSDPGSRDEAEKELRAIPGVGKVLKEHPPTAEEIETAKKMYLQLLDAALRFAQNEVQKKRDKGQTVPDPGTDPDHTFPYFFLQKQGWSMTDRHGVDWSKEKNMGWLPGEIGRFMFSMRDDMTGQGVDGTLLFPNALNWDLPESVIRMTQAAIRHTIKFYQKKTVMNAIGGAQEYLHHRRNELRTAGLEELMILLDSNSVPVRLEALEMLLKLEETENETAKFPLLTPKLPSFIHVHTLFSYPGVEGVYSPSHMIFSAHQQGVEYVYLVDHETVGHIEEGVRAAKIVNEARIKRGLPPLKVMYGVEFRAFVDRHRFPEFSQALARGVGRNPEAAWVVAMGVPVDEQGQVSKELKNLVEIFQMAKNKRAEKQIQILNEKLNIDLKLNDILRLSGGNITERMLADLAKKVAKTDLSANQIRAQFITPVSYEGFPDYLARVNYLEDLGLKPAFTMQLELSDLEKQLPFLKGFGIKALDLSGIESHHEKAEEKIAQVIELAKKNDLLVVGGSDYRGANTAGWLKPAAWMQDPAVLASLERLSKRDELRKQTTDYRPQTTDPNLPPSIFPLPLRQRTLASAKPNFRYGGAEDPSAVRRREENRVRGNEGLQSPSPRAESRAVIFSDFNPPLDEKFRQVVAKEGETISVRVKFDSKFAKDSVRLKVHYNPPLMTGAIWHPRFWNDQIIAPFRETGDGGYLFQFTLYSGVRHYTLQAKAGFSAWNGLPHNIRLVTREELAKIPHFQGFEIDSFNPPLQGDSQYFKKERKSDSLDVSFVVAFDGDISEIQENLLIAAHYQPGPSSGFGPDTWRNTEASFVKEIDTGRYLYRLSLPHGTPQYTLAGALPGRVLAAHDHEFRFDFSLGNNIHVVKRSEARQKREVGRRMSSFDRLRMVSEIEPDVGRTPSNVPLTTSSRPTELFHRAEVRGVAVSNRYGVDLVLADEKEATLLLEALIQKSPNQKISVPTFWADYAVGGAKIAKDITAETIKEQLKDSWLVVSEKGYLSLFWAPLEEIRDEFQAEDLPKLKAVTAAEILSRTELRSEAETDELAAIQAFANAFENAEKMVADIDRKNTTRYSFSFKGRNYELRAFPHGAYQIGQKGQVITTASPLLDVAIRKKFLVTKNTDVRLERGLLVIGERRFAIDLANPGESLVGILKYRYGLDVWRSALGDAIIFNNWNTDTSSSSTRRYALNWPWERWIFSRALKQALINQFSISLRELFERAADGQNQGRGMMGRAELRSPHDERWDVWGKAGWEPFDSSVPQMSWEELDAILQKAKRKSSYKKKKEAKRSSRKQDRAEVRQTSEKETARPNLTRSGGFKIRTTLIPVRNLSQDPYGVNGAEGDYSLNKRGELRWNPQATDELRDAVVRTWHLAFTEKQKGEISKALFDRHVAELNRLLDLDAHQGLKPQIVRANAPTILEDPRAKLLNLLNDPKSLERKYDANLSLEVLRLADQLVLKEDDKDRAATQAIIDEVDRLKARLADLKKQEIEAALKGVEEEMKADFQKLASEDISTPEQRDELRMFGTVSPVLFAAVSWDTLSIEKVDEELKSGEKIINGDPEYDAIFNYRKFTILRLMYLGLTQGAVARIQVKSLFHKLLKGKIEPAHNEKQVKDILLWAARKFDDLSDSKAPEWIQNEFQAFAANSYWAGFKGRESEQKSKDSKTGTKKVELSFEGEIQRWADRIKYPEVVYWFRREAVSILEKMGRLREIGFTADRKGQNQIRQTLEGLLSVIPDNNRKNQAIRKNITDALESLSISERFSRTVDRLIKKTGNKTLNTELVKANLQLSAIGVGNGSIADAQGFLDAALTQASAESKEIQNLKELLKKFEVIQKTFSNSRTELRWNPQATDELRDAVVRTWHLAFTEKKNDEISQALFERHVAELNRLLDLDAHQGLKPEIVRANVPTILEDPRAKLLNLLNDPTSLERKYDANLSLEVRRLADQLVLKEDDKDRAATQAIIDERSRQVKASLAEQMIAAELPVISQLAESGLSEDALTALALGGILPFDKTEADVRRFILEVQQALINQDPILKALGNLEALIDRNQKDPLVEWLRPTETQGGLVMPLRSIPSSERLQRLQLFLIANQGVELRIPVEGATKEDLASLIDGSLKDLGGNLLANRMKLIPVAKGKLSAVTGEQASELAKQLRMDLGKIIVLLEGSTPTAFQDQLASTILTSELEDLSLEAARDFVALLASIHNVEIRTDTWIALNQVIVDALDKKVGYFAINSRALLGLRARLNQIFAETEIKTFA